MGFWFDCAAHLVLIVFAGFVFCLGWIGWFNYVIILTSDWVVDVCYFGLAWCCVVWIWFCNLIGFVISFTLWVVFAVVLGLLLDWIIFRVVLELWFAFWFDADWTFWFYCVTFWCLLVVRFDYLRVLAWLMLTWIWEFCWCF